MFIISTLLAVAVILQKMYFLFIEGLSNMTILWSINILIYLIILIAGIYFFQKEYLSKKRKITIKVGKIGKLFFALSLIFISFSFIINYSNRILEWDTVALFDARARFLLAGIKFSNMPLLSKFDPQNSYYYLLYPPYTSIIHFIWYKLGIGLPIGIYYSISYMIFGFAIYLMTKEELNKSAALMLTFLVLSYTAVFNSSILAYTNLPYSIQMFVGIFLLYKYLINNNKWPIFLGLLLIASAQWIRILEPLWIGIFIALFVTILKTKRQKKELIYPIIFLFVSLFEYCLWNIFMKSSFVDSSKIVTFGISRFIEPIIGIISGSFINILIIFFKYWGIVAVVHLTALIIALKNKSKMFFLGMVILFSSLIYFGGFYFVSFQTVWWDKLGDSLIRSSTFLLPISIFVIISNIINNKLLVKNRNQK